MRGLLDFAEVPNGDMLLFNLAYSKEKSPWSILITMVEYIYSVQLAENFKNYVANLLQIGLVGNEI